MSILVVDDEPHFAAFVSKGLEAAGFRVEAASTGAEGYQLALQDRVDLVLLDVGLPDLEGFSLLSEIRRERPELPIIMLTARGEVEDRVRGLNLGANDYLPKPFAFSELVARIRSQLRMRSVQASFVLSAGDLAMDLRQRTVRRGDHEVRLTPKEFAVLEFFLRHRNQVLSKGQLLNGVWEYDFDPASNIVEVYVGYLRHKLDRAGEESLIETVRGGGYRLRHE
ncbi:MAG: response regulator transcription factor [Thermoleophilia bacterium]|nr:response regulator transcription factor [Thermoleophilia bacterium]